VLTRLQLKNRRDGIYSVSIPVASASSFGLQFTRILHHDVKATSESLRILAQKAACSRSPKAYIQVMNRIQVSPGIHFGKPCVAGTRIPVQAVLELIRESIPFESIVRDYYPDLKLEDIKACVQYAIDVVQTEDIHVTAAS
jgi:uncharacterized protein (DUF433 family)